jgi:DNA-binding IclR family transcriptional regulator
MDMLDLFFNQRAGLTLTDISNKLGIPKSSAHAILQTMRRRGYLVWDPETKAYSIGLRVVALAQASPVLRTIQTRARPYLERLAYSLTETVMLGAYEADAVVCVDTVESPDPVHFTVQLGERRPLHGTSLGKLYLASLGDEEVRELLGSLGLRRLTADTIVDVDALLAELAQIRLQGYAANLSESIEGVSSFGAAIFAHGSRPVAGVSVVGASNRIEAKSQTILAELIPAVRELSREVGEI